MNTEGHSQDSVVTTVLQDPAADRTHVEHEQPHDQAAEVAHAWHHFWENVRFFACFFTVILISLLTWSINFGPKGNIIFAFITAALRSGLIVYFMGSMFKSFSFVTKTFVFGAIFLAGMIFLSWWDSELRGIGDPIKDRINPPTKSDVP